MEEKISEFNEWWAVRGIFITSELNEAAIVINEELVGILLNNLFAKATRHNYNGSSINITLSEANLTVSNSSHVSELDSNKLFQRFSKAQIARKAMAWDCQLFNRYVIIQGSK